MTYFIRLNNSNTIRRGLLESGKELVTVLRGYQKILAIRDEKRELMVQMQQALAELTQLGRDLEEILPDKTLEEVQEFLPEPSLEKQVAKRIVPVEEKEEPSQLEEISAESPKRAAEPKKEAPAKKDRGAADLERLEKALSNIEERLGKL